MSSGPWDLRPTKDVSSRAWQADDAEFALQMQRRGLDQAQIKQLAGFAATAFQRRGNFGLR